MRKKNLSQIIDFPSILILIAAATSIFSDKLKLRHHLFNNRDSKLFGFYRNNTFGFNFNTKMFMNVVIYITLCFKYLFFY